MKKHLLALLLCCIAICGFAQEHLSFKGIPIEGSMSAFCEKLKAKGFTEDGTDKNMTLFTGNFTGRKATVGVIASDDGKNVFSVTVFFESSSERKTLVSTYDYYKDLYTRKYGEPSVSKEIDSTSRYGDMYFIRELREGKNIYNSVWEVPGGDIRVSIEKTSQIFSCMVVIRYSDSQNVETKIQRDLEDI